MHDHIDNKAKHDIGDHIMEFMKKKKDQYSTSDGRQKALDCVMKKMKTLFSGGNGKEGIGSWIGKFFQGKDKNGGLLKKMSKMFLGDE